MRNHTLNLISNSVSYNELSIKRVPLSGKLQEELHRVTLALGAGVKIQRKLFTHIHDFLYTELYGSLS